MWEFIVVFLFSLWGFQGGIKKIRVVRHIDLKTFKEIQKHDPKKNVNRAPLYMIYGAEEELHLKLDAIFRKRIFTKHKSMFNLYEVSYKLKMIIFSVDTFHKPRLVYANAKLML